MEQNGFNNPIISNPEFLREGSAVHDFLYPDRIIIGYVFSRLIAITRQIGDGQNVSHLCHIYFNFIKTLLCSENWPLFGRAFRQVLHLTEDAPPTISGDRSIFGSPNVFHLKETHFYFFLIY